MFWTLTISAVLLASSTSSMETSESPIMPILPSSCSSLSTPTWSATGKSGSMRCSWNSSMRSSWSRRRLSSTQLAQVVRLAEDRPDAGAGAQQAGLGRDEDLVAVRRERLGDDLLADVRAVRVGGVDEVDAELDGAADHGDGAGAVLGRSPDAVAGELHGAVAETVDGAAAGEREGAGVGDRGHGCSCEVGGPCANPGAATGFLRWSARRRCPAAAAVRRQRPAGEQHRPLRQRYGRARRC